MPGPTMALLCMISCVAPGLEADPASSSGDRVHFFRADGDYPPRPYRRGNPAADFDAEWLLASPGQDAAWLDRLTERLNVLLGIGEYGEMHSHWPADYGPRDWDQFLEYLGVVFLVVSPVFLFAALMVFLLRRDVVRQARSLRRIEARYRTLVRNLPDAVVVVQGDRILFGNPAAAMLFLGKTTQSLEGRNLFDFVHAEERESTRLSLMDAPASGGAARLSDLRIIRPASKTVRHVACTAIGMEYEGRSAILALFRDITKEKESEHALRESEEKYHTLFDASSDAIFLLAQTFLDCNQRACDMFMCSREEIVGKTPADFSPPEQPDGRDSRVAAEQLIADALGGKIDVFHWKHRRRNGEVFDAEISLRATHVLGSRVLLATARDISDRIRAAEEIRRERDLVRTIADTSPVGIVMVDATGRFTFANPRAGEILALDRAPLCRSSIHDTKTIRSLDDQEMPAQELPFARILRARSPVTGMRYSLHYPGGRKTLVSVSGAPLLHQDGSVQGVVFAVQDITARVEADRRREGYWKRVQSLQATVLAIAKDASVASGNLDHAGKLISKTAADTLQVSQASLWMIVGDGARLHCVSQYSPDTDTYTAPDDLDMQACPGYAAALESERYIAAEDTREDPRVADLRAFYIVPKRVDALLDVSVRVGGKLVGVLSHEFVGKTHRWDMEEVQFACELADQAAQAIVAYERRRTEAERRLLEAQMQHAQKLESLGVLAGGIAHDFNNLLMAILGNAELAAMDILPSHPARKCISEIETVTRRAADLCRQILAYAGRGRFIIEPVNVNDVIREFKDILEMSVSKRARLRYELAPTLASVDADATQMQQVVMNLVVNASEAMGDKDGVITLFTAEVAIIGHAEGKGLWMPAPPAPGAYVSLRVSDTGAGMDDATRSRIFDPFFSTKFTGRGLGLAAVLGIVRGHRGAIRVISVPGQGSTFEVALPASGKAPPVPGPQPAPCEAWRGTGAVMVVDDEEPLLAACVQILQRLGLHVIAAQNGREALDLFRRDPAAVDCVILDLTMPQMDGFECLQELRRIRPDVPVVLSSGYNEQDVANRLENAELTGFLHKPYRVRDMVEILQRVLDK